MQFCASLVVWKGSVHSSVMPETTQGAGLHPDSQQLDQFMLPWNHRLIKEKCLEAEMVGATFS